MRSHDNAYKGLLIFSVFIDILLCLALFISLIYYIHHGKSFSTHYIIGFAVFFFLFITFLIALGLALKTKKIPAILVTVAVTVARFLSAIIIVIAWMSDYGGGSEDQNSDGVEDPYRWISNRKFYLIIFTIIYIPIFCMQLYVLNRYYSQSSSSSHHPKYTTTLHFK